MANAFITVMNGATSLFRGIQTAFIWFLFASPVIAALIIVLMMKKYKHTIILRQKTKGDTDKILMTKFAIIRKRGDFEQIKTLKRSLKLPIPPEEAIDIKDNGAWFVEGYLTEGGEVTWITADAKRVKGEKEIAIPLPGGKGHHKIKTPVEKFEEIKLTRLSTQDKSFYFNREKQASDKYAIHGFWDFVGRNAGIIGLVMVVFVLFLFWGDIMEPAIQAKKIDEKRMQLELEIVGKLDQIINDRQQIPDDRFYNTTAPGAPE